MSVVQGVNDGYGPVLGAPSRNTTEVNDLDFMNLLVAQIQNQDPLSPMDNSEFTSQMTQFSMLDELNAMQTLLEENLLVGQSINNTSMLALVGKDVTVQGDALTVSDGEVSENVLVTQLPGQATITVKDEAGNVVRTYREDVNAGLTTVTWDGRTEDGDPAEDGDYTISVEISSLNSDTEVPFTTLMTGPVEGMRYENNVAVVLLGGQEYYVTDIYKVS